MQNHAGKEGFALELLDELVELFFPLGVDGVSARRDLLERFSWPYQNSVLQPFFHRQQQFLGAIEDQDWPDWRFRVARDERLRHPLRGVPVPPLFLARRRLNDAKRRPFKIDPGPFFREGVRWE